jgi:hypothetical protein
VFGAKGWDLIIRPLQKNSKPLIFRFFFKHLVRTSWYLRGDGENSYRKYLQKGKFGQRKSMKLEDFSKIGRICQKGEHFQNKGIYLAKAKYFTKGEAFSKQKFLWLFWVVGGYKYISNQLIQ